ncbi:hypothetical protein SPHV1_2290037 [Novosphingobium sp. KN65.2]|nr:hypothetical protein SPHV1_2290037 [Novosphingobium sp. KN65.2]
MRGSVMPHPSLALPLIPAMLEHTAMTL